MSQTKRGPGKTAKFILGAERYERISAVEGIALKPAMKKRHQEAKKSSASAAEYRKTIIDAYRKG
jgi:hypothetical protein